MAQQRCVWADLIVKQAYTNPSMDPPHVCLAKELNNQTQYHQ